MQTIIEQVCSVGRRLNEIMRSCGKMAGVVSYNQSNEWLLACGIRHLYMFNLQISKGV